MDKAIIRTIDRAVRTGDVTVAEYLIDEHPELISTPIHSCNKDLPLSHAANIGQLNIVVALLRCHPADVDHAFGRACLQGHLDVVQYLLEKKPQLGAI